MQVLGAKKYFRIGVYLHVYAMHLKCYCYCCFSCGRKWQCKYLYLQLLAFILTVFSPSCKLHCENNGNNIKCRIHFKCKPLKMATIIGAKCHVQFLPLHANKVSVRKNHNFDRVHFLNIKFSNFKSRDSYFQIGKKNRWQSFIWHKFQLIKVDSTYIDIWMYNGFFFLSFFF